MFTGLIQSVCEVKSMSRSPDTLRLEIDLGGLAKDCETGDSVAVNGACLTIAGLERAVACFDVSSETLSRSALGKLRPRCEVNIELAMKATDQFGGHFVQGHIDGTATISRIEKNGDFWDIEFTAATQLLENMVLKGSVAVDGVSLTVAKLDQAGFGVAIIPKTWEKTTFGKAGTGGSVNIETDIIVKTVRKQLENILPKKTSLTVDKLRQLGF